MILFCCLWSYIILCQDHIYSCDWHPEQRRCLATSGRDKCIKIWETAGDVSPSTRKPTLQHEVFSTNAVAKIKWRPFRRYQIARFSLLTEDIIQIPKLLPYYPKYVIKTTFLKASFSHFLAAYLRYQITQFKCGTCAGHMFRLCLSMSTQIFLPASYGCQIPTHSYQRGKTIWYVQMSSNLLFWPLWLS